VNVLTVERLRELLSYDANTGMFRWLAKSAPRSNRRKVGDLAGCVGVQGYVVLGVEGRSYRAHRLAWFYVHGVWPEKHIDHINGNRADNRIENLRDVSAAQNNRNLQRAKRQNQTGLLGVFRNGKRWSAQLRGTSGPRHLGMFDTPEEAHMAYLAAKQTAQFINQ
jgi:hypothetical protein